jgi:hypothetical protein
MIVGEGLESAAQSDKRKPPLLSPCLPKAGENDESPKSRHARQIRSIFKVTRSWNNVAQEHWQCERLLFDAFVHPSFTTPPHSPPHPRVVTLAPCTARLCFPDKRRRKSYPS